MSSSPQPTPATPATPTTPAAPDSPRPPVWAEYVRALLAVWGLAVSTEAFMMSIGHGLGVGCNLQTPDACTAVYLPAYANHMLVPLPFLGWIGYAAILFLTLGVALNHRRPAAAAVLDARRRTLVLIGFGLSVYLTAFQLIFIGQLCPICASSAVAMLVLAGLECAPNLRHERPNSAFTTLKIALTLLLLVPPATFGLSTVWNPMGWYEARKKQFLDTVATLPPQVKQALQRPGQAEKPYLILINREKCPFCATFYGDTVYDPAIQAQLQRFQVWKMDLDFEQATLTGFSIDRVPALCVVMKNPAPIVSLTGNHAAADVEKFLRYPLSTMDKRAEMMMNSVSSDLLGRIFDEVFAVLYKAKRSGTAVDPATVRDEIAWHHGYHDWADLSTRATNNLGREKFSEVEADRTAEFERRLRE